VRRCRDSGETARTNLFGAAQYLGAAAGFAALDAAEVRAPVSASWTVLTIAILCCAFLIGFRHAWRGLVQRVADAAIFLGLAGVALLAGG
jgi:hypothetical protein